MSTMIKGIEMPEPTENEISPVNAMATAGDSTLNQALSIFMDQAIPAVNNLIQTATEVFENTVEAIVKAANLLRKRNRAMTLGRWYYPKYYHYAVYSKKYRIRKKYMDRLIKLSLKRGI